MDEETRVLVRIRVDRSLEDIDTAKELLSLGRYRAAVNRAYCLLRHIQHHHRCTPYPEDRAEQTCRG